MATTNIRHRSLDGAGRILNRAGFADATSDVVARAEPSASVSQVSGNLPTSVKALTGFIVVLGVILLGLAGWRIGVWRRNKMRDARMRGLLPFSSEKKDGAIRLQFSSNFPQDKDAKPTYEHPLAGLLTRPAPAHAPNKAIKKDTSRFFGAKKSPFGRKTPTSAKSSGHPPPSYQEASPPPAPKIQLSVQVPTRPPPPPTPLTSTTINITSGRPSPAPSPRSSSYGGALDSAWKTPVTGRPISRSLNGKRLPRLMFVGATFVPTLPDELPVKLGETLRLVEEYEDEWCLVQKVGRPDAEKGVVPRFCLQERPEVIGTLPLKHKKGAPAGLVSISETR